MLGFDGGAIGADIYCDRSGIHSRSIQDCSRVLDALKDPEDGYYDPRDPFTTVPRSSVLPSYAVHARGSGEAGSLAGVRLGVIRESMAYPAGSLTEKPIVDAVNREVKEVLRDHLGATLVESSDRNFPADPEIETMKVDFRRAIARLLPVFMPDILYRLGPDGQPVFKEFAEVIVPTEFTPGIFFGSGEMQPVDYYVELADGLIEPPVNLDLATIQQQVLAMSFRFHIRQYLSRRSADWRALGYHESLVDWPSLNARSKFWGDDQRAAFKNWEEVTDMRNPLGGRQGVDERIMLRELLRRVDMMVILENKLDALVRLHTPYPPAKIGGANQNDGGNNIRQESTNGPNAGLTEVLIPAGYVQTAYDPVFRLSADRTRYESAQSDVATALDAPGLPFSLVFRTEPGKEDILLTIASAYEAASRRRVMPPDFGPMGG
jgi:Asp-tRNA(Asn)/Glu-tRNA(Gln) amidotransferase A subunit family amidase